MPDKTKVGLTGFPSSCRKLSYVTVIHNIILFCFRFLLKHNWLSYTKYHLNFGFLWADDGRKKVFFNYYLATYSETESLNFMLSSRNYYFLIALRNF